MLHGLLPIMGGGGHYAHVNDMASDMIYDHEYRRKQHRKGRKWAEDDYTSAKLSLAAEK